MTTDDGLELRGIEVTLRGKAQALFTAISLRIEKGEIVTVMGASGVGKSTLLDAIAGLLDPVFELRGKVILASKDVTDLSAEKRGIGVMFQEPVMFPHLSVGENLAFGLRAGLKGRQARRAAIEAALESAGLAGFYYRDPATLSGGQRARAALMRTLLAAPKALLLDEPFSRLDVGLRAEIRAFVFNHARSHNLPVLLVTHDAEDAKHAAGRLVQL